MGRPSRSGRQHGWHHVVNRGSSRRSVFRTDGDRTDFLRLLGDACDRWGVEVKAYCLMGNHYHLVLDCPHGGLSPYMQHLSGIWTRRVNDRRHADGPIFRGRFTSRVVETPEYLVNAIRYVHTNPLAFLDPPQLATYRWSSHRSYLGRRASPVWLASEDVIAWLGGRSGYERFVMESLDGAVPAGAVGDLLAAIEQVADAADDGTDRNRTSVRLLAWLATTRLPAEPARALRDVLGSSTEDAARQAAARARRAAEADPDLVRLVEQAFDLVRSVHLVSDTE